MEAFLFTVVLLATLYLAYAIGALRLFNPGIGAVGSAGRVDRGLPHGMQEEDRDRPWGRRES